MLLSHFERDFANSALIRFIRVGLAAILFVFSFCAQAQTSPFTPEQIKALELALKKTPADKTFYHWTSNETGFRWVAQGRLDKGEVDFYNQPTAERQLYGAGIYLAESPTSSKQFGEFPVAFIIPAGTPIFDSKVVHDIFGRNLNAEELTRLGQEVPFIRNVTDDWYITHHPKTTNRLEYAGLHGVHSDVLGGKFNLSAYYNLVKHDKGAAGQYLNSFLSLLYFVDGISIIRSIKQFPQDPWSQFEPERFESFKNVFEEILARTETESEKAYWKTSNSIKTEEWSQEIIEKSLPSLFQKLFSTHKNNYRRTGIVAGGTVGNGEFLASPQALDALLQNPYLDVTYRPNEEKSGFYISYKYPEVRTFERIKHLLSNELSSKISQVSVEKIIENGEIEAQYNQEIVKDLLKSLFNQLHGKEIEPAHFLRTFISIHPFEDGNGRISRLFLMDRMAPYGKSPAPMFMSDLDLLVSENKFSEILSESHTAYRRLFDQIFSEYISTIGLKKQPDYFKLSGFQRLFESLSPLGITTPNDLSTEDYQKINARQFHELISSRHGIAWDMSTGDELVRALELASRDGLEPFKKAVHQRLASRIQRLLPSTATITEYTELLKYLNDPKLKTFFNTKELNLKLHQRVAKLVYFLNYSEASSLVFLENYLMALSAKDATMVVKNITSRLKKKKIDIDPAGPLAKLIEHYELAGLFEKYNQGAIKFRQIQEHIAKTTLNSSIFNRPEFLPMLSSLTEKQKRDLLLSPHSNINDGKVLDMPILEQLSLAMKGASKYEKLRFQHHIYQHIGLQPKENAEKMLDFLVKNDSLQIDYVQLETLASRSHSFREVLVAWATQSLSTDIESLNHQNQTLRNKIFPQSIDPSLAEKLNLLVEFAPDELGRFPEKSIVQIYESVKRFKNELELSLWAGLNEKFSISFAYLLKRYSSHMYLYPNRIKEFVLNMKNADQAIKLLQSHQNGMDPRLKGDLSFHIIAHLDVTRAQQEYLLPNLQPWLKFLTKESKRALNLNLGVLSENLKMIFQTNKTEVSFKIWTGLPNSVRDTLLSEMSYVSEMFNPSTIQVPFNTSEFLLFWKTFHYSALRNFELRKHYDKLPRLLHRSIYERISAAPVDLPLELKELVLLYAERPTNLKDVSKILAILQKRGTNTGWNYNQDLMWQFGQEVVKNLDPSSLRLLADLESTDLKEYHRPGLLLQFLPSSAIEKPSPLSFAALNNLQLLNSQHPMIFSSLLWAMLSHKDRLFLYPTLFKNLALKYPQNSKIHEILLKAYQGLAEVSTIDQRNELHFKIKPIIHRPGIFLDNQRLSILKAIDTSSSNVRTCRMLFAS